MAPSNGFCWVSAFLLWKVQRKAEGEERQSSSKKESNNVWALAEIIAYCIVGTLGRHSGKEQEGKEVTAAVMAYVVCRAALFHSVRSSSEIVRRSSLIQHCYVL